MKCFAVFNGIGIFAFLLRSCERTVWSALHCMTVSKDLRLFICFVGGGVVGCAMVQSKLPVPGRPTNGGWGWSGGAMVLGKLPVPGRPTIWITIGQGPTALTVGAGGGCLDIFTLLYPFSPLSPSLWETARYRLKYCLKGPLNPKQPTNQSYKRIRVGQGPTAHAVDAGGGYLGIFLSSFISLFFLPLSGRRPDIDLNTVSKGR